ncbi:protein phosphatase 2C domain-containing protein [Pseudomonas viridiflava]|uniref:PP2C family protein-serine/threonine phosphatase n=1 Tax=Pseudomonas viridiflava TaxID=33069 RepID=UPI002EB5EF49|nr:protein phosphatase 2C domain-containing protein [Pseudomonas viridiflava]MEE3971821.1 protein phosphatase 2C domain-containing protein [Pseudomonas viridiflava]MEE4016671.1 protein phosphatase 2C domain-containing protein [Pseudomonas viridiflava]MEE4045295.1 protein phosphatase 2C domain-containing protein [Pseudomonas viridiflava]
MIKLLSSSAFSFPKEPTRKNEDSILPPRKLGAGFLMAIADGVGSYAGASSASESAIEYLTNLQSIALENPDAVEHIFEQIKIRVTNLAAENPRFFDAATTLTFCYAGEKGIKIGHVGDCRIYIKNGNKLLQLTKDHTQHQKLIDEGLYKPSELKDSGGKNTLFSAISKKINLHFQEIFLRYNEICAEDGSVSLFIMSDGAYHSWELRPRFLESTLEDPNRFAANLRRRIIRLQPTDDCSLIAVKLTIKPQLELFD